VQISFLWSHFGEKFFFISSSPFVVEIKVFFHKIDCFLKVYKVKRELGNRREYILYIYVYVYCSQSEKSETFDVNDENISESLDYMYIVYILSMYNNI